MSCVRNVSIRPTSEIASDVGRTIPNVERENGTFPSEMEPKGIEKLGNP